MIDEALHEGWKLHRAGDVRGAEQLYQQALSADPNYAPTWYHLGILLNDLGRSQEAIAAYQRAIELAPCHTLALNNLGNLYGKLQQLDSAMACFDRAIAIDRGFVLARKNQALTLHWAGHVEAAIGKLEAALPYAPNDAEVHYNLATMRLLVGDFAGGWPEYAWRWKGGYVALPRIDPERLWNGSALYGKTILLSAEQGLGDVVQFVRYAAWLKCRYQCRTLLFCPPALRTLLSRCEGIDAWVEDTADPNGVPPFDVFAPLTHVPAALAHTPADFPTAIPYVFADAQLIELWRQRLAPHPGRKIGICWRAGDKHPAGAKRNIPLAAVAPLTTLPGCRFFSLQKGPGAEEIRIWPNIVDLGCELDETTGAFVETAAVLMNLDLLITCDTAIAHVAGALGVPVWLALAHVPDWRWGLTGDQTSWYPTMRLFRQTVSDEWLEAIERIAAALASRAQESSSRGS
jgi:tetratricopeptide (TPR) repeat protein